MMTIRHPIGKITETTDSINPKFSRDFKNRAINLRVITILLSKTTKVFKRVLLQRIWIEERAQDQALDFPIAPKFYKYKFLHLN